MGCGGVAHGCFGEDGGEEEDGVYTSRLWEGLVCGRHNRGSLGWDGRIADLFFHYLSSVGLVEDMPVAEYGIAKQFRG